MKLPKVVTDLIKAQNDFDSVAYANCFAETGVMFDEGKSHTGRAEIGQFIEEANQKYRSVMKPLVYTESGSSSVLSAEVSGTFEGSPIVLKFNFDINDGLIHYLKVTG
jgi:hypothetical protein